jgi:dTDP-4-amino-4,6-dideoxygalactose transaminase
MRVERYHYPSQFGPDVDGLLAEVREMLLGGRYVLTPEVKRFEDEFARYLGVRFVRGVNSGTDALVLALRALDIGPGDEVITQANTFNATVAAIELVGATTVLVDADEETFLIDGDQVESAISPATRAVLPVHLYGKPTPMSRLLEVARKHGLAVVEDAAQAHGARVGGRCAGTFGTIGCFSFHPSKNLAAAGDAGAVVTDDERLDEALRRRRELGQCGQNHHVVVGLNSKLDAIQALILSRKLPHLERWNEGRRAVAAVYRERLRDLPLRFQRQDPGEQHVYHLFQVRTDRRDALIAHLRSGGIDAVVRYPTPIHLQPAFEGRGWGRGRFPVSERLAEELLCLPVRPDMGLEEIDLVCGSVRSFFRGRP